jgi:hypothetical protein
VLSHAAGSHRASAGSRRAGRTAWLTALLLAVATAAGAQRGGYVGRGAQGFDNPRYNGQFTFTRLRYNGGGRSMFGWGMSSAWNHDYPQADMHLSLILDALTAIQPNLDTSNILSLEDPEIFRNPVLYMWEPGYWRATDAEVANLRTYMLKGGFVIFDDFEQEHWHNFEAQFRRALPDAEFIELDMGHPIFHSFFEMREIKVPHPSPSIPPPSFHGVFEDNDPSRRMMALVNYNSDVAEYWEWSAQGRFPVNTTNDAYKLGINYMIYALTH